MRLIPFLHAEPPVRPGQDHRRCSVPLAYKISSSWSAQSTRRLYLPGENARLADDRACASPVDETFRNGRAGEVQREGC